MAEEKSGGGQKLAIITADITIAVVVTLVIIALFGVFIGAIVEWYYRLLDRIYAIDWEAIKKTLTIIFTIINALLVGVIIYSVRRLHELRYAPVEEEAVLHVVLPKEEVRASWEHIRELANSANPSDWNMAVLRADALLDDTLQHLGYEGTTTAERLKIVDPAKLKSVEETWSAHRLRNMIAHDPLEQHTRETIIHALRSYEQAFKELDMMEESEKIRES